MIELAWFRSAGWKFIPRGAVAATVAAALLVAGISAVRFKEYPKIPGYMYAPVKKFFNAAFPHPRVIYTDQLNLIVLFSMYEHWHWRYIRQMPMQTQAFEYELTRGPDRIVLIHDKLRWNLDFLDPALFRDLEQSMKLAGVDAATVFCMSGVAGTRTPAQQDAYQQKIFELAAQSHLQIRKFVPDRLAVFAEFALAQPDSTQPEEIR
jgi:hypothetical protein